MTEPVLSLRDVSTTFSTAKGPLRAVDGVSLDVGAGEAVGIVGESGSGKSVLVRSAMGLYDPETTTREGAVHLEGRDLSAARPQELRSTWGTQIAMVLQDPLSSLNPVRKVGSQLIETIRRHHRTLSRDQVREKAVALLTEVGIADPRRRLGVYPHQMSGGMRQRVMIAMALAGDPRVLVADEPTTALDVTVQQQILALLDRQRRTRSMGLLLVTHDLSVVAARTDKVLVMYAGQLVETTTTARLFARPAMPYTRALLDAVPAMTGPTHVRLKAIPGAPVDLGQPQTGCRFASRCGFAQDRCHTEVPELLPLAGNPDHLVRCHYPLPAPPPPGASPSNPSGGTS